MLCEERSSIDVTKKQQKINSKWQKGQQYNTADI